MCGAQLPVKAEAAKPAAVTPAAPPLPATTSTPSAPSSPKPVSDVSGPSFLGLSDQPASRGVEYLLEDEESHDAGRRRMYAALLLLVIAGILIIWQWRRGGLEWVERLKGTLTGNAPVATSVEESTPQTPGPPVGPGAATSPAPSAPMTSASNPSTTSSTPPPTPSDSSHMVTPNESAGDKQEADKASPPPATNEAPSEAANEKAARTSQESAPQPAEEASAGAPAPTKSSPKREADAPSAPAVSADDKLVADGEKYLYGNGTTANCALAQKNLNAAAARSNPKALSMLGTMYATGHCVPRSLPAAYRSFAKALHQDPSNGRVQQDLEILWRQMSPEERQMAIK